MIFLAQFHEDSVTIRGETICAKRVCGIQPLACFAVNSSQIFPAYARRYEGIHSSDFQQIKEAERHRVIDWIELAIPNGRRTVAPAFHSEFVAFQPTANPLRRDVRQP